MNATDRGEADALTIQPCANGFIVTGRVSFQHSGPIDGPSQWYAFESFEALVVYLRKRLVNVGVNSP